MIDFLIISAIIIGVWVTCKVIGIVGLLVSDLWNTFIRR